MDQIVYVNGSFVPASEARVSIFDRGFLFADGIYEVSAIIDGKLVDNESHLARLVRSVGEIKLALPETIERIKEIQKELIARNKLANGMVYIEVTRGADTGRDFLFPKAEVKSTLVMFTTVKDMVSLNMLPSKSTTKESDTLLMLLYGYAVLKGQDMMLGTQLIRAARQSGISLDRIDRALVKYDSLLLKGGQRKGRKYGLNNQGKKKAN